MSRFRRNAVVGLALVAALALTSCTSGGDTDPTGGGDDSSVTVGLVLEPSDLDIRRTSGAALEQVLIDNVYEGLVSRTADGEIVDTLAASHEVSEDGLTYTFTLNDGVTFHSGNELTVDDVVWSLTGVKDDDSLIDNGIFANVSSIAAEGDDTVVITLSAPDSNFLWNLTGRGGLVFEEADDTDLSTAANGTGPYTLDRWRQGSSISLARFDDYWGDAAQVSEVVFEYIPDATAGVNAIVAGDIDVLTPVDANLRDQVEAVDELTITEGRTTDKYTLAFNNQRAPLDDVRVREALRLAIDHEAIIAGIGGAGIEQGGPIPELDPGFEDLTDVRPFDPERARTLLAEAGQSDLELTLTIPNIYATTVSNLLVSQFKDVGVTLNVESVEFSAWLEDVYTNKDFDLSFVDHLEARDFGNWANPEYYFGYDNPEVQSLFQESIAATDEEQASALLAEAARIVAEDHAGDVLYNATALTAVADGITGFPTDSPNARLDLGDLAVE
jgi:peptide/nickel transport system substrate-binding protein